MPGRIFISYRRDDVPGDARGLRDGLATRFGKSSIFMDVDNLLAGQRFDEELAKALASCDVFLAVIGPRWMEQLAARTASGERDYVREEIAAALKRRIVVIPVRVGREGQMPPLPRAGDLPDDIRDLVHYQKQDVAHERFGRDIAELVSAIRLVRQGGRRALPWRSLAAACALLAMLGGAVMLTNLFPLDPSTPTESKRTADAANTKAVDEAQAKRAAEEAERQRVAMLEAEDDRKRAEAEAKRKADADAKARADAESKRTAGEATPNPRPGETFRDCDVCPEMVVVPAGEFMMGSNDGNSDEKPVHKVTISQPFAVGKFEVTFAEWEACMADEGPWTKYGGPGGCKHNPGDNGWGKGRRPVINVSWNDAKEYVAWLSRKTGKSYRLLTEAEWEYAVRAGTMTKYSFGDTITKSQAQFSYGFWASAGKTAGVGSFPANRFGLHDMHGNVWEWCEDNWHANYQGAPNDGSVWPGGDASRRVLRGGSWNYDFPVDLRSAFRHWYRPDIRVFDIGFRVARTLDR